MHCFFLPLSCPLVSLLFSKFVLADFFSVLIIPTALAPVNHSFVTFRGTIQSRFPPTYYAILVTYTGLTFTCSTSDSFFVKNRSSVFTHLVGSSTSCCRLWSSAMSFIGFNLNWTSTTRPEPIGRTLNISQIKILE